MKDKSVLVLFSKCLTTFIIVISVLLPFESKAQVHFNIINAWGYNIIDFEELMGVPYWSEDIPAIYTQITDDSPFVYKGGVQLTFDTAEKVRLGGEFSINRLYYVEERYSVELIDTEYRWRMYDIWTLNLGALSQIFLNEQLYIQSGVGIHYFLNGSGVAPGVMAGIGYVVPLNDQFTIPIEFKNDWVFGDATSGIFSLALGFTFDLNKN
jgi:hypothetical protein